MFTSQKFQSHYRSDFNVDFLTVLFTQNKFQSHYRSDFNAHLLHYSINCDYFNPIIGLILTRMIYYTILSILEFQSHYRSDFNRTRMSMMQTATKFQSHYRSDFNCNNFFNEFLSESISIPL